MKPENPPDEYFQELDDTPVSDRAEFDTDHPEPLTESVYDDLDADGPFEKIDQLLAAEHRTFDYDCTGRWSVGVGYPDVYENGIANLSHQVVHKEVNARDGWYASRTYEPSPRLQRALVDAGREYFTWEDRRPLSEHDLVTFTLSFEELATKMLRILDHSGIPLRAADREDDDPLVVCGGTTPNYNPEPYADFVDLFYLGEAEVGVDPILAAYEDAGGRDATRHEHLKTLASIQGVYVPEFYEVEYAEETGELLDMVATEPEAAGQVYKTVDEEFVDHPAHTSFVTPHVIYDEACFTLEVARGCAYSCNFCQYGHNNRSPRWMDVDAVVEFIEQRAVEHADIVKLFYEATEPGYLDELFEGVGRLEREYGIDIRLGAFTANQLTERMVRVAAEGGQQCIIVAPETAAGDQRFAIGKEGFYDDEEIFQHAEWAAEHGIPNFGLYMLMGIPGETTADIEAVAELISRTRAHTNDDGVLEVHINPVFPKPLTPFQWARMERPERSVEKLETLSEMLSAMGHEVTVDCVSKAVIGAGYLTEREQNADSEIILKTVNGTKMHYSQPIIARGDRRVGRLIQRAYERGDTYETWTELMAEADLSDEVFFRERDLDETLPWEFIHNNVEPAVRENKWTSVRDRVESDD